jgi:D-alanine-D-alanine ligase
VESLHAVARRKVDLIFNLTESWAGDDTKDANIAGYLELLGRPFTGSSSLGLALGADKVMAKKIFQFHGIPSPNFATVFRGRMDHAHDIQFPVIVKPAREDGSIGIKFNAYVESIKDLMTRIDESTPSSTLRCWWRNTWRGGRSTWGSSATRSPRPCRPSSST